MTAGEAVQLALFDYKALDNPTRIVLLERTDAIKAALKTMQMSIINVGEDLAAVQDLLADGRGGGFTAWLKREFDWSRAQAYNFINVYELSRTKQLDGVPLGRSVLYYISAPSTPEAVVDVVLDHANAGEHVSAKVVREVIASLRQDGIVEVKAAIADTLPPAAEDKPAYDPTDVDQNPIIRTHPRYGASIDRARCGGCREEHCNWKPFIDQTVPMWKCLKCGHDEYDEFVVILTPLVITQEAYTRAVAQAEASKVQTANGKKGGLPMSGRKAKSLDEDFTPDNCQTPPHIFVVQPILEYLDPNWLIWESACGKGNMVAALRDAGMNNIHATDLATGTDYFTSNFVGYDLELTNFPFSKALPWLARAFERNQRFAFLAKGSTLFSSTAQRLFVKYGGVEIVTINKRINFEMPYQGWDGNGSQFNVAWFTWGLNIGQQLTHFFYSEEQWAQVPQLYKSKSAPKKKSAIDPTSGAPTVSVPS